MRATIPHPHPLFAVSTAPGVPRPGSSVCQTGGTAQTPGTAAGAVSSDVHLDRCL